MYKAPSLNFVIGMLAIINHPYPQIQNAPSHFQLGVVALIAVFLFLPFPCAATVSVMLLIINSTFVKFESFSSVNGMG